ncbi:MULTISPECIES: Co2+/Mg2+ efflux protein ApaG [unclassified Arsukibacterium]|uniref:Co2+/Mg2+ efflux protein ApaG n=1 Tax=unclassified Arsukibacterium TaxID=2635278 RepID=UPI000C6A9755|nr:MULTISPECIES: Co2+/Mg2+ efflux protein ApaG [unclassified Arsukibacterium]MAA95612.1 Co2+/Mg2+ efflux protein ApaG [Rheinheimera sp.]MBM33202.1 Co2+/Mg2+ efflux protein ApaG [Rheinheimera sp.]HAW92585.1 Co2+/Mg2+ efflux protein ApaG [Candidatus Azambacteria bacterium]
MSEQFDILIKVDNFYLGAQSDPTENRFVFAYTITIENCSNETVTLLKRYWLITDANGKQAEVYGDGVVGEQPELVPGSSYSYTSGAVLETPVGTMQGHYEMISRSEQRFNAAIPVFRLAMPNILN